MRVNGKSLLTQRRNGAAVFARSSAAPLRRCVSQLFLTLILDRTSFGFSLGDLFAGHAILALDPTAEIYKLASLRTERTEGIIFPFNWLTAGWTLHNS
jgi:hypothetical protein